MDNRTLVMPTPAFIFLGRLGVLRHEPVFLFDNESGYLQQEESFLRNFARKIVSKLLQDSKKDS